MMRKLVLFSSAFFLSFSVLFAKESWNLSLEEALLYALEENLQIQAGRTGGALQASSGAILQVNWEAARERARAQWGIFEPRFFGSAQTEDNERLNISTDFFAQSSNEFSEQNDEFSVGLQTVLPTAGTFLISGDWNVIDNSLQASDLNEYKSFWGVSLNQPLLRNSGLGFAMRQIRSAAHDSDRVLNQVRANVISILTNAELSYWQLYQIQNLLEVRSNGLKRAKDFLQKEQDRYHAGESSGADVALAEANLADAEADYLNVENEMANIITQFRSFLGLSGEKAGLPIRATDSPEIVVPEINFDDLLEDMLNEHPTIRIIEHEVAVASIEKKFRANQRLPRLDFVGNYGFNGLGDSASNGYDDLRDGDRSSWSVGLQFEIPMFLDHTAKKQHSAAKKDLRAARMELDYRRLDMTNRLQNSVDILPDTVRLVEEYREAINGYEKVVKAETDRMNKGNGDIYRVLQASDDLDNALQKHLDSVYRFKVNLITMEFLSGTYLKNRNLDTLDVFQVQEISSLHK